MIVGHQVSFYHITHYFEGVCVVVVIEDVVDVCVVVAIEDVVEGVVEGSSVGEDVVVVMDTSHQVSFSPSFNPSSRHHPKVLLKSQAHISGLKNVPGEQKLEDSSICPELL